ncbi:hypothetical protein ACIBQ0_27985 [Nocardia nova]|uniref:hypothetical protein n=1 Tax=Nocardia TaxID=1817 RepID=UPI0004C45373|nr:hypothetical protein [Nocardia sp. NRRL WC-3656]
MAETPAVTTAPCAFGAPGLLMRIDEVMRRHAGHTLLRIVTAVTGPAHAVPDYLTLHAEAVVDEAVRHIVAHPGADTVVVTASVTTMVTVVVEATGPVGILLPPLLASSARARLLGGHCAVDRGARLVWSVPLPPADIHARVPAGPARRRGDRPYAKFSVM